MNDDEIMYEFQQLFAYVDVYYMLIDVVKGVPEVAVVDQKTQSQFTNEGYAIGDELPPSIEYLAAEWADDILKKFAPQFYSLDNCQLHISKDGNKVRMEWGYE